MPLAPQIPNTPVDVANTANITAASKTGTAINYTIDVNPGFAVGDIIWVQGFGSTATDYNGQFTITAVSSLTITVSSTTTQTAGTLTDYPSMISIGTSGSTDYDTNDLQQVYPADTEDLANPVINPALAQATQAQTDAANALAQANTAIANAAAANTAATSAAYQAGVAQTTANGKNTAHYSTSAPSGSGTNGDIWFQVNTSGTVLYQYVYNGSSWVSAPISNTVIANLDAGKINAGTITGIAYNNGSGTFSVSPSGVLVATSATITGNITATSGTFTGTVYASAGTFTGTVTATSGSFTGTINTVAGNIGGFTIDPTGISSPSYGWSLSSGGTLTGGNSNTLYYGYINVGGGTSSGQRLYVTGNSAFIGTGIFSGDLTVQSNFYVPYHVTTGSSANAYINASTGLLARSTSSLRYKVDVQPQEIPFDAILALEPKSYFDKSEYEEHGSSEGLKRILGVIAEEVAEIPVLGELLMNRNTKGEPDSINYDRIAVAILPLLKNINSRLSVLEGK